MKKPKILVVGSLVMDLIVSTEKIPNSGETVLGKSFSTATGGKGANQAVQMSRLGADVTMVGRVGDDGFGKELVASVYSAGIDSSCIGVDIKHSSSIGNVLLEVAVGQKAKNRIIVVPGANMAIKPEHVAFLKDTIGQFDMVILQLEIPMEINELVVRYAHEKGVPIMMNPAPSAPLSPELLACLTYISPNEHEVADLTGITIRKQGNDVNRDDIKAAAGVLLDKGVKNVIITLGSSGAVFVSREEFHYSPCIDIVEVKDPTAAGDSFVGAFSTAVCSGLSHSQALAFANYTATLTVSKLGAQPSLSTLSEVLALMRQENFKEFDLSLLNGLKVF